MHNCCYRNNQNKNYVRCACLLTAQTQNCLVSLRGHYWQIVKICHNANWSLWLKIIKGNVRVFILLIPTLTHVMMYNECNCDRTSSKNKESPILCQREQIWQMFPWWDSRGAMLKFSKNCYFSCYLFGYFRITSVLVLFILSYCRNAEYYM